jgi:hypothetical protein
MSKNTTNPTYIIKYFKKIVINEITRMLNTIHLIYPKTFTEAIKIEMIQYFVKTFKLYKMTSSRTERLNVNIQCKLFKRNVRDKGFSIHKRTPPTTDLRCVARIWAEGRVVKNGGTLQYGDRCFRKHISGLPYCKQHLKNNTHGDFNKPVDNKTVMNFKKFSRSSILKT